MARDDLSETREQQPMHQPASMVRQMLRHLSDKHHPLPSDKKLAVLNALNTALTDPSPETIAACTAVVGENLNGRIWDYRTTEPAPAKDFHPTVMSIAPKGKDGVRLPRREIPLKTKPVGDDEVVMQCLRIEPEGKALKQLAQALEDLSDGARKNISVEIRQITRKELRKLERQDAAGPATEAIVEREEMPQEQMIVRA